MSQSIRTKRYRTHGGAADLVRVEVMVPPQRRQEIIDIAVKMRAEYREGKLMPELECLHRLAVEKFGDSCLWNAKPSATREGMMVVADQLRSYGGMDAWRLATKIREVLTHAA